MARILISKCIAMVVALGVVAGACTILEGVPDPKSDLAIQFSLRRGGQPLKRGRIDLYLGSRAESGGLIAYSLEAQPDGTLLLSNIAPSRYEAVLVTDRGSTSVVFRVPFTEPVSSSRGNLTLLVTAIEISRKGGPVVSREFVSYEREAGLPPLQPEFQVRALMGTVTDPSGAVIPKAAIKLYRISNGKLESLSETTSDDRGGFLIHASGGKYVLEFTVFGFRAAYVPVNFGRSGWDGVNVAMKMSQTDICGGSGQGYEHVGPYEWN